MTTPGDDQSEQVRATREALKKADDLLGKLGQAGPYEPSAVSQLGEATARIKMQLEAELVALELICQSLGL